MENKKEHNQEEDEVRREADSCINNVNVLDLDDGVHGPRLWSAGVRFLCSKSHQSGSEPGIITFIGF